MRDRMIELLLKCDKENDVLSCYNERPKRIQAAEILADHLLANGVIVPPVSVGQTVYVVNRYYGGLWRIHECRVDNLTIFERHIFMSLVDGKYNFGIEKSEIGKTVFLTKEEAEKALAERSKE